MRPPKRVLIIEDNAHNLELATFLLEEGGMAVLSATDAEQARAVLAEGAPDLILMDMNLPGTDGLSLLAELRADPRLAPVPVVAVTAYAMRGDRERFLRAGCDGYLSKPIDVASFVAQVLGFIAAGRLPGPAGEGGHV